MQLTSRNVQGTWQWNSTLLINYVRNKITHYNTAETNQVYNYTNSSAVPVVGRSRDVVYAFPWNGLDGQTGFPVILVDGKASSDYQSFYDVDNLIAAGVSVPPYYGSLRNDLQWKGIALSLLLTWKQGYVFRRESSIPGTAYTSARNYHMDYLKRWKSPGDERYTNVPAHTGPESDGYMASVYEDSEILVTSGNHIRIQDINLSYTMQSRQSAQLPFRQIRFYAYARNLGTLWRANKFNIDPDYARAEFPAPRTFALGLQFDF